MFKLGNMLFFSSILVCFCKVNLVFFLVFFFLIYGLCRSPKFIKEKKKVIFCANFKPYGNKQHAFSSAAIKIFFSV